MFKERVKNCTPIFLHDVIYICIFVVNHVETRTCLNTCFPHAIPNCAIAAAQRDITFYVQRAFLHFLFKKKITLFLIYSNLEHVPHTSVEENNCS